ncbi:hypothetical protein [Luteimicrobium sp. DT211]|uniref:hypothetical protein n=1 Tax=Luteimicrobium sp. DT211 TaxID=3393412 RepID=UPI003CF5271D
MTTVVVAALLVVAAVVVGLVLYRRTTRAAARAVAAVRAARPGWWVGAVHGSPALARALVVEGTWAPALGRSLPFAGVVAAGPPGLELWDARRGAPVAAWPWRSVASVTAGEERVPRRGTASVLRVETLAGAVLPLALAARGTGWAAAREDEVADVVGRLRELRDGA